MSAFAEYPVAVTLLSALAVVAVLLLLDRVAVRMERRGWIYWRTRERAGGGSMAGVLTEVQALVEPRVRHVAEDRRERRAASPDGRGLPNIRRRGAAGYGTTAGWERLSS